MNLWILAQSSATRMERIRSMSDWFNENQSQAGSSVLLRIVLFLMSLACIFFFIYMVSQIDRRRREPGKPQPMALFFHVLSELDLPFLDRWRLWRVVKSLAIEHPTALLISEKLYDQAVDHYCKNSHWLFNRRSARQRFACIRKRLFEPLKDELSEIPDPAN